MASPAELRALRNAQAGVSALVERDLARVFSRVASEDARFVRDVLLEVAPRIVDQYAQIAQTVGLDWYRTVRAAALGPNAAPLPPGAPIPLPDTAERVIETVRRAAGSLFGENADPAGALHSITSKCQQYALEGARDGIRTMTLSDPASRGWSRSVSANACDFCVDLAARGAVYSADSAEFEAHNGCNCTANPEF